MAFSFSFFLEKFQLFCGHWLFQTFHRAAQGGDHAGEIGQI